jgi:hypothetical protein
MIAVDLFFVVLALALLFGQEDKAFRYGGATVLALSIGWLVQDVLDNWLGLDFWFVLVVFGVVSFGTFIAAHQWLSVQTTTPTQGGATDHD